MRLNDKDLEYKALKVKYKASTAQWKSSSISQSFSFNSTARTYGVIKLLRHTNKAPKVYGKGSAGYRKKLLSRKDKAYKILKWSF